MVKRTQTIRWLLLTHCVSVFDHFVRLALEGFLSKMNSVDQLILAILGPHELKNHSHSWPWLPKNY